MTVAYSNTLDDLASLYRHHLMLDWRYRWRRRWELWGFALLLGVASLGFDAYRGTWAQGWERLPGYFVIVMPFALIAAWRYYRFPKQAVLRMLTRRPQSSVLCAHTLTVEDSGFTLQTGDEVERRPWTDLHRYAFTRDHVFLYITDTTAHIIPRRELGDATFAEVAERIRAVIEKA